MIWHKSINNKNMPFSLFCLFWFCAMSKRHIYPIRSKKMPLWKLSWLKVITKPEYLRALFLICMAENENSASILIQSGLILISTNSPICYFSKFTNDICLLSISSEPDNLKYYSKIMQHFLLKKKTTWFALEKSCLSQQFHLEPCHRPCAHDSISIREHPVSAQHQGTPTLTCRNKPRAG